MANDYTINATDQLIILEGCLYMHDFVDLVIRYKSLGYDMVDTDLHPNKICFIKNLPKQRK